MRVNRKKGLGSMGVEALKCPNCGGPLKSGDALRCEYCGVTLSGPKQVLGKRGAFRGIARNVHQRQEDGFSVLTFRVERVDNVGNILDYVQVELREPRIRGTLVDGDKVEVEGEMDEEGILAPNRIFNLRTKAFVAKASSGKGFVLFLPPFIFAAVGFAVGSMNRSIGPMEGAMGGFLAGCFLAVFIFIILAVAKR
jgi:hypothetical protein